HLCSHCLRGFTEPTYITRIVCPSRCFLDQRRAFERFAAQGSDASFELRGKFVLPAGKSVNPSFHRIFVNRIFIKSAGPAPAIVIDESHRRLVPASFAHHSPFQRRRDNVVPFFENIGFDHQIFAGHPLDRVATAIDQRLEIFNDRARKGLKHGRSIKRISVKGKWPKFGPPELASSVLPSTSEGPHKRSNDHAIEYV